MTSTTSWATARCMASRERSCSRPASPETEPPAKQDMKTYVCSLIFGLLCGVAGLAQPAMTSTNIIIDIAGNGGRHFDYTIGASGPFGDFPVTWVVGSNIDVLSFSRFLRASSDRVFFEKSELVGGDREIFQGEDSIGVFYGFGLIGYQAESYSYGAPGSWEYITRGSNPLFLSRTDALLGVRLKVDEVFHYGWLRLSRPVADNHTLFEVSGYDWNPVPGAPIGAGEPPGPPPLHSSVNGDGRLLIEWDAAYGEMVLEWAGSLADPVDWQPVPNSGTPPVQLPLDEAGQRFYRLRRP